MSDIAGTVATMGHIQKRFLVLFVCSVFMCDTVNKIFHVNVLAKFGFQDDMRRMVAPVRAA